MPSLDELFPENKPQSTGNYYQALADRAASIAGVPSDWIYAQWRHETGDFTSPLTKENNFGGITQTTPNDMPQPDGSLWYKRFNSPEEYADYFGNYLKLYKEDGIDNAKTPEDYAMVLKRGGYYGDSPENYIAGLRNFGAKTVRDGNSVIDNLFFSKAEASPAPVNPNSLDALFADNKPQITTQPVKANSLDALFAPTAPQQTTTSQPVAQPTAPTSEVAGLPALFDEMGNPNINTEGSGLGKVVNDYFAQPVANAVGTVIEYADKPRGAIAGGVNALIDQTNLADGIKKGWQENTSWKETLPKSMHDTLAGQVTGLAMDIALDPLWLASPAKAVSIVKRAGKALNADKAVAPIVNALEKAKNSEQVQSILNKEFELPGWGNITVKRALSEKGPIDDLLDKLKIDKAKLNEQVAEAGKVLEPISEKGREFVTKGIEATPANFTVPASEVYQTIKAGEVGLPVVSKKPLTELTFKEAQETPNLLAKIAEKNPDVSLREAYFQELDKSLLKGEKIPLNVLAEYSNARPKGIPLTADESALLARFNRLENTKDVTYRGQEIKGLKKAIPETEYMPKDLFEKEIASPYNQVVSEKVKELFPEIVQSEPYKKFANENLLPWTVSGESVIGRNLAENRARALVPNRYWEVREAALKELRQDPAFVAMEKQYEAGKSLLAKQEVNANVRKFSASVLEKEKKAKVTDEQIYNMMGEGDIVTSATSPVKREEVLAKARLELPPQEAALVESAVDSLSKFGIGRSDELLKRNIISQETYDKYYGRYIRREYLKNENPLEFAKQLKEAGNVAEAEKIEKAAESIANNRFKKSGVKMNWDDIKQRQNLSEAEQEALGRIMDASHPFAKGGQVSSDLIAKYDFLEGVKNQFGSATEQAGYRLLEGKGYGPLSGTWVPKEVYNEVTKTVRSFSEPETMWRQAVSWWKMGKTILNPAGHARNFMSNAILLDIGGVPTAKVPVYLTRAAKEMLEKGKYYKEVKENTTILLDTFKQAEALQLNKPGVIKSVVDKAGDIYQKNEEMGKMAAYMYARETGKDIAQAAKFANDTLFDYGKVPPVIDYLRRSGLVPFASFPYFATKATAKTLYREPMDVLKYYKPSVAGKTEEQKAQEKLYPKWMQPQNYLPLGKSTRIRDGKEETVDQFLDTSFIFPFDNDVSVSPAFTLAASLATNKNWLTGADIARKGQLPTDKAEEYFKYAAQQLLPSFAPYGYSTEKLAMAFKGEMDKQGRQYTPQEAVAHTIFGLKNVPINTDEMAKKAFQGMKRDIMDTRLTMRDIMRDKRLTADQKQQRIKEYQEHIKQLSQQAQVLQKAYKDAKGKSIE